ncbi:acyl-CoA-binding protein [Nocardia sp. NPDC048505]|uniref:acyl-CoA-binding domain-containing protein n=1 Tax=unclassified Nocardia TaxID=2637762 RepID=UPI0033D3CDD2
MSEPLAAFETAHAEAQRLNPALSERVQLYAYYQQAVVGDNTTAAPEADGTDARAKWNLWAGMKGMSAREAQSEYIALVENLKRLTGE